MRHIALYRWNTDTSPEVVAQVLDNVRAMAEQIPQVIRLDCGLNLAAEPDGYTHYVEVEVADREAYVAYKQHPAHRAVAERIGPLLSEHLSLDTE